MRVLCKVNCNGMGYENFKVGEEREIQKDTAKLLIDYGYAEPVAVSEKPKKPEKPINPEETDEKPENEEKQLEP